MATRRGGAYVPLPVPCRPTLLLWGGGALLPLAKAVLSTEGSTGGESSSELTLAVTDRSQFQSSWLEPSPASQGISTGQLASYRAGKVEEGA